VRSQGSLRPAASGLPRSVGAQAPAGRLSVRKKTTSGCSMSLKKSGERR
jgi:hypothetical protein